MTRIAVAVLSLVAVSAASLRARGQDTPEAPAASQAAPDAASPDAASPDAASADAATLGAFMGFKIGAAFRQPFSRFGTAVAPEVELGKLLWKRRLAVLLQFGYTRDVLRGTSAAGDPSLPSGGYSWKLTEWDLAASLGLLYRHERRRGTGYAGALVSLHLQESRSQGRVGDEILGDTREQGTAFGAAVLAGIELNLGPGAAMAEGEAGWVALDHRITGSTNLAALTARLGYRLYF